MISEISCKAIRGRFLILINFFVSVGKIYAFLMAYLCLEEFDRGDWRLMMFMSSFTSLLVGILSKLYLMESPRYLLASNGVDEAMSITDKMIEIN